VDATNVDRRSEDPAHRSAHHAVAGGEGRGEGGQGRPRGGDRGRAGRGGAAGARRREGSATDRDGGRAGAHRRRDRRPGPARCAGHPHVHGPFRRFAVQISERYYGTSADWRWIYEANRSKISNPNDIYVGERLTIPAHARPRTHVVLHPQARQGQPSRGADLQDQPERDARLHRPGGTLGRCRRLARRGLHGGRDRDGGIGRQAVRPEPDRRLRLLADQRLARAREATFNALGNARAAIAISDDGSDWDAWTTYTSTASTRPLLTRPADLAARNRRAGRPRA
jgi:hypothetical protein